MKRERAGFEKGFTLVEMLVIMAILVLLCSLLVPAVSGILHGLRMEQGIGSLRSCIELARLEAGAQNRPVEVRFFRDPNGSIAFGHYMGFQLFILKESGMKPLSPLIRLPVGVVIGYDDRTSLLNASGIGSGTGSGISASWVYRSFEIAPSGETSLPRITNTPICLALGEVHAFDPSRGGREKIAAMLVDPLTARTSVLGW